MMQTELLYQSLSCFYEYLIALRSISMPLIASATTAKHRGQQLWQGEFSIIIPAIWIGRQSLNQSFVGLLFGLGIFGFRALWSASIYSAYQRISQFKVLIVIKEESDDNPKQSCVATNLSYNCIYGLYCPRNFHGRAILDKFKVKVIAHDSQFIFC